MDNDEVDKLVRELLLEPEQVANVVVGDRCFQLHFNTDSFCVSSGSS